jgi:hypothetical protein
MIAAPSLFNRCFFIIIALIFIHQGSIGILVIARILSFPPRLWISMPSILFKIILNLSSCQRWSNWPEWI